MGPTPQVPQDSFPTLPKPCAESLSQMQAYSKSGSMNSITQLSPQEAQLVNTRLVAELHSVVVMNNKWQKYHKQQEKYITDLRIQLDQQKLKTEEAEKRYSHVLITQRLQEQKIKGLEETITCFGSLMEDLDKANAKIQKFEEEANVTRQISEKVKSQDRDERAKLLQYQLQACIDDFKNEEKEKVKLQDMCNSLQTQLCEANQLIAEYREKVNIMKSIDFPTIHKCNPDADYIQREKLAIHRRRNRMSSSAPTKSSMSCRLDGAIHFPSTIEADSSRHGPHGFELAPNFSSSESEEEHFDESLEMVRH